MKTLRLEIYGHVQGVFFRDSIQREAQNLTVSGWVRNRSNGSVEAAVQGDDDAVDTIVRWTHHGPSHARVDRVEISPDQGNYTCFKVTG